MSPNASGSSPGWSYPLNEHTEVPLGEGKCWYKSSWLKITSMSVLMADGLLVFNRLQVGEAQIHFVEIEKTALAERKHSLELNNGGLCAEKISLQKLKRKFLHVALKTNKRK